MPKVNNFAMQEVGMVRVRATTQIYIGYYFRQGNLHNIIIQLLYSLYINDLNLDPCMYVFQLISTC